MAFIVEDGTGLANSNSYVSVADADSYFADRGVTTWTGIDAVKQGALVRATSFIDVTFRQRFTGYRGKRHQQALEWPRIGAYYDNGMPQVPPDGFFYGIGYRLYEYEPIDPATIPKELKNATCEAALRELAGAGSLTPDLDSNGAVKRERAGDTEREYIGGASLARTYPGIFAAISGLLGNDYGLAARAVRG
jgi:hypothetical protein